MWSLKPGRRIAFLFFVGILELIQLTTTHAHADTTELRLALAADLRYAFETLIGDFQEEHRELKVTPIFGSSGNFATQIEQGAPFDLFFSADTSIVETLEKSHKKRVSSSFPYAVGHLAIWVLRDSKIPIEKGLLALTSPEVKKIAIANPVHAPYGKAAVAALKNASIYKQIKSKLVLGDNVAQASQFVQAGAAEVGIIAQSLAQAPIMMNLGRFVTVSQDLYPKMQQSGAILSSSSHPKEAQEFRDFVLSPRGQGILSHYGLDSPKH
jgi:molybdate transport system substrate-binding protein